MLVSHRRCWPLGVLLLAGFALVAPGADPMPKTPAKPLDLSKFPPGTIFVIGDDVKDVAQQPGLVVLSQEEFQKLRDELAQLKKTTSNDKAVFAGQCKISGRVEGDLAHLQVRFDFETLKAKTLVPLGCKNAWPTAAVLDDGRLPLLSPPGEDGFAVQIDKPGPHQLILDLDVAVTNRTTKGSERGAGERGFELSLPGAAVTLLEHLDVPDHAKELRLATTVAAGRETAPRTFSAKELNSRSDKRHTLALGPIEKLDVTWKGPTSQQPADTLLASTSKIEVAVEDTHVTTDVDLKLEVLRGIPTIWKLQVPGGVQATVDPDLPPGDERTPVIERPTDPKVPVWTIKPKGVGGESVPLHIRVQQPRTQGKTVAIGPFLVLGAVRQQGTVRVTVPPDLRARYRLRGDISQREVAEAERRGSSAVAMFNFWSLPQPVKEGQNVPAPLDIDIENVKGAIETAAHHTLRLAPQGWQVTSEIDVKPERMEVERLEFELPATGEFKAAPPALVEPDLDIRESGPGKRIGTVRLTQRRTGPFKVVLTTTWPLPDEPRTGVMVIALPRPLQTLDRGGRVTVQVPDDKELVIVRESGMQTLPPGKQQQTLEFDRAPSRVEVAWREFRPELPIKMFLDVTLTERQALVRQHIQFLFPVGSLRQVTLRGVDFPPDRAPTAERVPLKPEEPGAWSCPLKESSLTLEYTFRPQPDKITGSFTIPLLWPDGMSHGQTKVRIWSEPGAQPSVEGRHWEELPLEVVEERNSLPALVLRSSGLRVPLRLKQNVVSALPTITLERVLVQAALGAGGHQSYRVRFLMSRIGTRQLDMELPGSPSSVNLDMLLDGKHLGSAQTVDEDGNEIDNGRIVRLILEPELYRRPVILDVSYQVLPGRTEGNSSWQATLYPPRLRGNIFPGRIRWDVVLPNDRVPLWTLGSMPLEQRWGMRGWLPAPRAAATTSDLERWFAANPEPRSPGDEGETTVRSSAAVCWQGTLAPLTLLHLSEQVWLLACSGCFLALGIGLYFAAGSPRLFGAGMALFGLGVLLLGLFGSNLLPVLIYGSEPGIVVLLLIVGWLWWRQDRYRRQVVFMPGFTRLSSGSSVVRTGSASRLRGEPSTIDGPPNPVLPIPAEVTGSRQEVAPRNS